MSTKINLLMLAGATILTLTACASNTTTSTEAVPTASIASPAPTSTTAASPTAETTDKAGVAQKGGQVVEMGNYHLELLAAPEGEDIHVDFWLLTGADHTTIADAKVTANIQFPNGTQKTVEMTYDAAGQHYKALVPGFVTGEYRVIVQTEQKGEKVNGRFNFSL